MLAQLAFQCVSHKRGDHRPGAWQCSKSSTHRRSTYHGQNCILRLLVRRYQVLEADLQVRLDDRETINILQKLRDAEQAQGECDQIDAFLHIKEAKGKTRKTAGDIYAESAQKHAEQGHGYPLDRRPL